LNPEIKVGLQATFDTIASALSTKFITAGRQQMSKITLNLLSVNIISGQQNAS